MVWSKKEARKGWETSEGRLLSGVKCLSDSVSSLSGLDCVGLKM